MATPLGASAHTQPVCQSAASLSVGSQSVSQYLASQSVSNQSVVSQSVSQSVSLSVGLSVGYQVQTGSGSPQLGGEESSYPHFVL